MIVLEIIVGTAYAVFIITAIGFLVRFFIQAHPIRWVMSKFKSWLHDFASLWYYILTGKDRHDGPKT